MKSSVLLNKKKDIGIYVFQIYVISKMHLNYIDDYPKLSAMIG